jgi:hypothetical protein
MIDNMIAIMLVAAVWSLQFAIVMGVALASRWILRFFVSSEAIRPRSWTIVGIWLVTLVASNAYWGYTGWFDGRLQEQFNSLHGQIQAESKQAAESQGEIFPPAQPMTKANPPKNFTPQPTPIYNAEYLTRSQKAQVQIYNQSRMPNIKSERLEWFLWLLWFACGLTVAGYCYVVLRKSSGLFKAAVLALAVAVVHCFVIGIPTFILTLIAYVLLGGELPGS